MSLALAGRLGLQVEDVAGLEDAPGGLFRDIRTAIPEETTACM
jgi:hypothetical protein